MVEIPDTMPNDCVVCGELITPYGSYPTAATQICGACVDRIHAQYPVEASGPRRVGVPERIAAVVLMFAIIVACLAALGGCVWIWQQVAGG